MTLQGTTNLKNVWNIFHQGCSNLKRFNSFLIKRKKKVAVLLLYIDNHWDLCFLIIGGKIT